MLVLLAGYTAGYGQFGIIGGINGKGSTDTEDDEHGVGCGGGYYDFGASLSEVIGNYESWFGLGGCWTVTTDIFNRNFWSTAGSGGTAGQGGVVKYSLTSKINSYNGNMITEDDFNYNETYYEYDKDGNYLDGSDGKDTKIANVIELKNESNKKIIPARIFIQDGIKRAVYDNLCYMSEERREKYKVNTLDENLEIKNSSKYGDIKCVKIVKEDNKITYSRQGIGSGAGYIELDNGSYEVITNP